MHDFMTEFWNEIYPEEIWPHSLDHFHFNVVVLPKDAVDELFGGLVGGQLGLGLQLERWSPRWTWGSHALAAGPAGLGSRSAGCSRGRFGRGPGASATAASESSSRKRVLILTLFRRPAASASPSSLEKESGQPLWPGRPRRAEPGRLATPPGRVEHGLGSAGRGSWSPGEPWPCPWARAAASGPRVWTCRPWARWLAASGAGAGGTQSVEVLGGGRAVATSLGPGGHPGRLRAPAAGGVAVGYADL